MSGRLLLLLAQLPPRHLAVVEVPSHGGAAAPGSHRAGGDDEAEEARPSRGGLPPPYHLRAKTAAPSAACSRARYLPRHLPPPLPHLLQPRPQRPLRPTVEPTGEEVEEEALPTVTGPGAGSEAPPRLSRPRWPPREEEEVHADGEESEEEDGCRGRKGRGRDRREGMET